VFKVGIQVVELPSAAGTCHSNVVHQNQEVGTRKVRDSQGEVGPFTLAVRLRTYWIFTSDSAIRTLSSEGKEE